MLKLEIKFDESKITEEQKYTLDFIGGALDKAFTKHNFRKEELPDGTICFYGNGAPRDYGIFGGLITALKSKEWFVPYLSKWLWYNSDDGEDETDFTIEDVLLHYTGRESEV